MARTTIAEDFTDLEPIGSAKYDLVWDLPQPTLRITTRLLENATMIPFVRPPLPSI